MQIEITGKTVSPDYGYNRVEYSIFNDEDVSLFDSMSLAQACYLFEHNELQPGVFFDLVQYISTTEFDAIEIGKTFSDD